MQKTVVANLKMNLLTLAERESYFKSFSSEIKKKKIGNSQIVFCPPSVHIENFVKKFNPMKSGKAVTSRSEAVLQDKNEKISVGAQNIFWEERGPYTGEISAPMLKNLGAEYVILGHSDRRRFFGESNRSVNAKILTAIKNGLKVILCIGENGEEKKKGIGEKAIAEQLKECLSDIPGTKIGNIVICYEPVWAISTNNPEHPPTSNEIMGARLLIKKILFEKYGAKIVEKIPIIYGGSVESSNVQEVCVDAAMDGALVGRESLTPFKFVKIIEEIDKN